MPHDHNAVERSLEDRAPFDHETFRDWQAMIGWTNKKLADRLGVSERTVDNYRSGAVTIPGPVMALMPVLVRDELRARKG